MRLAFRAPIPLALFALLAPLALLAAAPAATAAVALSPADCPAVLLRPGFCRVTVEAAGHHAFAAAGCARSDPIPACHGTVFLDGRQLLTARAPSFYAGEYVCSGGVLTFGYTPWPIGVGLGCHRLPDL